MNSIFYMCERIGLQQEVIDKVIAFDNTFEYDTVMDELGQLLTFETSQEALKKLKGKLGEDPKGIKILTCMIRCLERTYAQYIKLGIPQKVFVDTMNCFPRFIEEHKSSYGTYGFDRDWWTTRQIGMKLFRIGELEYELIDESKTKVISVHIPSNARLSILNCKDSYAESQKFFKEYYKEYKDSRYICHSWLLSPALKELLPPSSNIIAFQEAFEVSEWNKEDDEFIEWVYKKKYNDYKELPEGSSLQRNMKEYLLNGGIVGAAFGTLQEKPWYKE